MLAHQVEVVGLLVRQSVIKHGAWRWIHDPAVVLKHELGLDPLVDHHKANLDLLAAWARLTLACSLDLLDLVGHDGFLLLIADTVTVEDQLTRVDSITYLEGFEGLSHHSHQFIGDLLVLSLLDVAGPVLVEIAIHSGTEGEIRVSLGLVEDIIATHHRRHVGEGHI